MSPPQKKTENDKGFSNAEEIPKTEAESSNPPPPRDLCKGASPATEMYTNLKTKWNGNVF